MMDELVERYIANTVNLGNSFGIILTLEILYIKCVGGYMVCPVEMEVPGSKENTQLEDGVYWSTNNIYK